MTSRTCDIASADAASVIRTDERPASLSIRLLAWVDKIVDKAWTRMEQRRQMRQLASLDDRMLRDLGLNPGQVHGLERHSPADLIRHPDIYGR
ncbi:MAG: DUF1127 domain-containing protein [Rhodospirillum sp.]|nr:DUF1127 domain-containing protein [Rhodospirillum sp.]MCF8490711.1 DUF1127 domain-containing protein [Rhodospirillum sp.]MCF8499390.1 DUF1127 domain-containing protein [Rhodospirillum sp.]